MENGDSCNVLVCFQDLMCLEHNIVASTSSLLLLPPLQGGWL
jgi:hypothetical protein